MRQGISPSQRLWIRRCNSSRSLESIPAAPAIKHCSASPVLVDSFLLDYLFTLTFFSKKIFLFSCVNVKRHTSFHRPTSPLDWLCTIGEDGPIIWYDGFYSGIRWAQSTCKWSSRTSKFNALQVPSKGLTMPTDILPINDDYACDKIRIQRTSSFLIDFHSRSWCLRQQTLTRKCIRNKHPHQNDK